MARRRTRDRTPSWSTCPRPANSDSLDQPIRSTFSGSNPLSVRRGGSALPQPPPFYPQRRRWLLSQDLPWIGRMQRPLYARKHRPRHPPANACRVRSPCPFLRNSAICKTPAGRRHLLPYTQHRQRRTRISPNSGSCLSSLQTRCRWWSKPCYRYHPLRFSIRRKNNSLRAQFRFPLPQCRPCSPL